MNNDLTRGKRINWLLFIGILLVSANLRAPITSVGVALPSIKNDLGLSNTAVSIITIIPLVAFAVISSLAAKTSRKFGIERTIFYAMIFILIGTITRSLPYATWLYIGTIFIGVGIAFGNVLAPALIKAKFPLQIGMMTGYYTVVQTILGSISSYGTAPAVKAFNYNIALSLVGIITVITLIVWSFQLTARQDEVQSAQHNKINIWKSPLAWRITLLMGGQSMIFYSLINWLPAYLSNYGISINEAGIYLSIFQLAVIPLTFVIPIWAAKMSSQTIVILITGALFVIGVLIMMLYPQATLIAVIILGIGSGFSFGLANTLFSLKAEESATAAKLSGMSQSVGYLFAAIGPLFFGSLHDATHSWIPSLMILLVTALAILIFSTRAGRPQTIEQQFKN